MTMATKATLPMTMPAMAPPDRLLEAAGAAAGSEQAEPPPAQAALVETPVKLTLPPTICVMVVTAVAKLAVGMLATAACAADTPAAPAEAGMSKLSATRSVCVDCSARAPAAAPASARRELPRAQKVVGLLVTRPE